MTGSDLRKKYLDFFKKQGHIIIPSASLVPENDPTTLFTSSGMQPMMPYLLGAPHPLGTRLVDSQKCFRSQDIEEVGNNRHTTFFEMLGNWSLGDYFKKEQITWLFTFLTQELRLPVEKLAVSIFEGDEQIPRDDETQQIWLSLGIPQNRIYAYGVKKNWWSRSGVPDAMPIGEPGGSDSEAFFEFTDVQHNPKFGDVCHPNCDCGRFLEICNSVFMKYRKQADGSFVNLPKNNIDFGGGLERILAAVHNDPDVFKTDLFWPIIEKIQSLTDKKYDPANLAPIRIITDHLKAATFMIADGIEPSNKQQGYVLRRLIRRAAVKYRQLTGQIPTGQDFQSISQSVVDIYPNYLEQLDLSPLALEIDRFAKILDQGLKQIEDLSPFNLYQSYGFPIEITQELYQQQGKTLDIDEFNKQLAQHQEKSRSISKGMFKGGLADHSEITTKYHTATHLLHQALRQILGSHVQQVGSNITSERLRFDFIHPQALTNDELKQVENLVNQQIDANLPVTKEEITYEEALKRGALAFFGQRYPQRVTVYRIGDFSQEVCGGPHVTSTGIIGHIELFKQESVGSGRRRLYARLRS